ncbi:hypothetical protein GCM10027442_52430 [Emticicia fontis]
MLPKQIKRYFVITFVQIYNQNQTISDWLNYLQILISYKNSKKTSQSKIGQDFVEFIYTIRPIKK